MNTVHAQEFTNQTQIKSQIPPPVFEKLTLELQTLSYLNTKALGLSEDLHNCGGYRYAILSDSHSTPITVIALPNVISNILQ